MGTAKKKNTGGRKRNIFVKMKMKKKEENCFVSNKRVEYNKNK